jgi:multisubunit Na+/H+ antiporter MnhG subunit
MEDMAPHMMQKHIVLTAVGLLLGLLALAWVRPNTSAGASLLLLVAIVVVNAVGALAALRLPKISRKRKPRAKRKTDKAVDNSG